MSFCVLAPCHTYALSYIYSKQQQKNACLVLQCDAVYARALQCATLCCSNVVHYVAFITHTQKNSCVHETVSGIEIKFQDVEIVLVLHGVAVRCSVLQQQVTSKKKENTCAPLRQSAGSKSRSRRLKLFL